LREKAVENIAALILIGFIFIVGFVAGYAVRSVISWRRRSNSRSSVYEYYED
jgi:hypothetical protein